MKSISARGHSSEKALRQEHTWCILNREARMTGVKRLEVNTGGGRGLECVRPL